MSGMGFAVTLASSSQGSLWALERCSRWENGKGVDVQSDRPLGWTRRVRRSPRQPLESGMQSIWAQKSADITGLAQSKGLSLAWLQVRTGKVMSARCMLVWRHLSARCGPLWWILGWDVSLCQRNMTGAGHVTGQELGFRKSKEDSAIRLKEPHVSQEKYDARPRQPTCQPGFPPPVHPPTPLLAPLEDVPGTVPGARATRANTTDVGPALITVGGR